MATDTKELVKQLQRKPADLGLYRQVKEQLLKERRHKSYVKVLRWWSKRAPTTSQGAQALFEAGEVARLKVKDDDQARELFEAAIELDPSHEAAAVALAALSSDEEFDELLDGMDSESIRPPSERPSQPPPGGRLPSVGPPPMKRASVRPPAMEVDEVPLPAPPAMPRMDATPVSAASQGDLFTSRQDDLFQSDEPPSAAPVEPSTDAPAPAARREEEGDDTTGRFTSERPPAIADSPAAEAPRAAPRPVALPADGTEPQLYDPDEEAQEEAEAVAPARFPIASIIGDGSAPGAQASGSLRLEVVRRRADTVVGATSIRLFGRAGGDAIRARRSGGSGYRVKLGEGAQGWVVRASAGPGAGREPLPEGPLQLADGDIAEVSYGGVVHQLRVARAVAPPTSSVDAIPIKRYSIVIAGAIGAHILGLIAIASLEKAGVSFVVETRSRDEIFAEARLKPPEQRPKPKLKKPKQIKLRKKKVKPPPTEERAKIPKSLRNKLRKIARDQPNTSAVDRLVNALKSPVVGEGKTLKEVVSNIDAIKGGESSGAFRIGGTLAALDGKGPNIVSGGGGDIGTLGGKEATGKLSRLQGKKRGKVRGKVTSIKALAKIHGSLSRGDVLKVLNKNQHKIQRCYERALLSKPSLAGRLTYMWTIKTNGRVGSVRNTGNTLGDNKVGKCIAGVIKGMKFPRPKGGSVKVTFPWIFKRAM